ncbi:phage head morphogenesis protein [Rodentibacter genomosp. 1]|uniref:Phage head morphogenesis protein n=1 Tax=Rodentibacter genomosp. 1 TaxID=1908264 RepID=A0A1V3J6L5_9PAST|nr:phage minor head protein [Rodentibacter genomosp. 1]OOF50897.1 phage head morphogenesis protein [Rodentibacter genomosp. 1]
MPNDNTQEESNAIDMGYVLRLEPKLAVDYLKSKGVNITWNWHEQLESAHARAFTVAKATKAEVLDTIRWATEKAISEGTPERVYIKELEPMLKVLGWWGKAVDENGNTVQLGSPRRLRTILRTNKSTAYHAARYVQQMKNVDEQPYWRYVAVKDSRTRTSHLALHGKIYRADDPIWQTMYPPNDWGCRCRVEALSEFAVKSRGFTISSSQGEIETEEAVAGIDKETGEEIRTKVSKIKTDQGEMKVGAGWNYNVGSAAFGTDIAVLRKLQQVKNRELRQQTIQAINNSEARHKAFADWVFAHLGKRGASERYISAGIISPDIAEKVTQFSDGKKYSERILVMTEKNLAHANSDKHHKSGVGLTAEEYAQISRIIANPSLVIWDMQTGNLIYFNQDRTIKVMVDAPGKLKKTREKLDAIINAYRQKDFADIKAAIKGGNYKIILGEL